MSCLLPFRTDERVALFIDGQHLNDLLNALKVQIDFGKFRVLLTSQCKFFRGYYYALTDAQFPSAVRPFLDWLTYNGYTVVEKPFRPTLDKGDRIHQRGSLGIELAIDALQLMNHVDSILLMAGDNRYCALVRAIQTNGVRVHVLSSADRRTQLADELRRQADQFIEIKELLPDIALQTEQLSSDPPP